MGVFVYLSTRSSWHTVPNIQQSLLHCRSVNVLSHPHCPNDLPISNDRTRNPNPHHIPSFPHFHAVPLRHPQSIALTNPTSTHVTAPPNYSPVLPRDLCPLSKARVKSTLRLRIRIKTNPNCRNPKRRNTPNPNLSNSITNRRNKNIQKRSSLSKPLFTAANRHRNRNRMHRIGSAEI